MVSVQVQQHKERMIKAYEAMEEYKAPRKLVTPVLINLLKIYNNEWEFIEAENYRALIDSYFDAQEAQKSPKGSGGGGPVTRARRALSGSDTADNSDESASPPRGISPPPRTPPSTTRTTRPDSFVKVKREPDSPALPDNVALAMDYHSGASVRTRAASQSSPLSLGGGSPGTRGRAVAPAAAAHERDKEKGKSPLVSQSRRQLPPQSRIPAPEGIEKVAFEKVDGVIIPAVRKPQNGAVASFKQAHELPPLTSRVKIEDETLDHQNSPRNQILAPTPLLAKDPVTNVSVHVQTEAQGANASSPDNNYDSCEVVGLDQSVKHELPLEDTTQLSPVHLQMVPYGTFFSNGSSSAEQPSNVAAGPSIDEAPKAELEKEGKTVLPVNNMEDGDANVLSLVDYEDDDALEAAEQGTSGAGCDVVLPPDDSLEQVEPPERNDEEIRPNFIVSGSKRDMVDAQVAVHPKRRKFEAETSSCPHVESGRDFNKPAPSTAPPRRRLILPPSPPPDHPVNGENDSTPLEGPSTGPSATAGVKRKMIISASPSTDGGLYCTSNGGHTVVTNGDKNKVVADRSNDRIREAPEARGQGNINSALKRVKLEPGVEDPSAQLLKHVPNDISRGTERVPIPFVNDFTSETINHRFNYIPNNVVYQNAYINISLARIGDEDFCLDCAGDCLKAPHSCPCTRETGGEFAYTQDGLLKPTLIQYEVDTNQDLGLKHKSMVFCSSGWDCPIERAKDYTENPDKCKGHVARKFVKECWHKCGCSMQCGNRVVQRGICRKLEVFFTNDGKGWGIRTAEDLPAGAFVCEYVGEIMTNMELDQRNQDAKKIDARRQTGKLKDTYPVLLDGDWCSESGLKDEEALCLDATRYGNVARFINHRCLDANLIDIPVSIETLDRHYYHVAFFTCRNVRSGEELTWDYKIDFDDQDHPIEAFQCLCNSEFCRGSAASSTKKHKK